MLIRRAPNFVTLDNSRVVFRPSLSTRVREYYFSIELQDGRNASLINLYNITLNVLEALRSREQNRNESKAESFLNKTRVFEYSAKQLEYWSMLRNSSVRIE